METTDCNGKKGRPLPLEQESRVCLVLNPPEVEPPRSYHLCDFFITFKINISNELSIATDVDDLHFEIKLSD